MCTIIGKKFDGIGWVGIKNRDRGLPTKSNLLRQNMNGVQSVTLIDEQTHWTEGMNSKGIGIISSSLDPIIGKHPTEEKHISKNGTRFSKALEETTVEGAMDVLKTLKATGCIMVFDKNTMYLIEGHDTTHEQVVKKITDDWIVRTNHGIYIPGAGYQSDNDNIILNMRRLSSEARLDIGKYICQNAKTPTEMMVDMAKTWSDNPQLTTIRVPTKDIPTRTTEQLMIIPGKNEMFIRNTDGVLEFNQEDANPNGSKVLIGVV
jgi:hypothetical protein